MGEHGDQTMQLNNEDNDSYMKMFKNCLKKKMRE
jgi:hypothetical protein